MSAPNPTVRIWDAPVRLFHGLLALCFAGAWLTAESERLRTLHVTLGLTMAGLVAFRLVWGVVGSRHARFGDFVRGPRAVLAYLRSLLTARPADHAGHNPAGGWMVLALLALAATTSALGWLAYDGLDAEWVAESHEAAASLMLFLVGLHVAGVIASSVLHRQNLVRAMITGRKPAPEAEDNGSPRRGVAVLLAAAVLGFWAWQWTAPPPDLTAAASPSHRSHGTDEHDDD